MGRSRVVRWDGTGVGLAEAIIIGLSYPPLKRSYLQG